MDFELFSIIAGIASILGVVFYLWDKYKKKREDKSNQDGSGSQNVAQISLNKGSIINIENIGTLNILENNVTNETIKPWEGKLQDEISEQSESLSEFDLTMTPEQISQILGYVSKDTAEQLTHKRKEWKEGHTLKVKEWLEELEDGKWDYLSQEIKADVLLFKADIELKETRDIRRVCELADKAQSLMPSQNQNRIRALIAYHEEGPEEAIKVLDNQNDMESLNLKADFLIELDRVEEAFEILNFGDESNGEA